MDAIELLEIIELGESSRVQFKERLTDAHALSQEFAAFANSKGGIIIVGVNDKTYGLHGLSREEISAYNQLAVNAASTNLQPPLIIETEQLKINDEIIMVITVPEGVNKPYKDNKGVMWMKNGADKRRVTSNDEIARLLQESKSLLADETVIHNSSIVERNTAKTERWLQGKYKAEWENLDKVIETALEEASLAKNGAFTLAGLLLLAQYPQKYRPECSVKCITVPGTSIVADTFLDNVPSHYGTLSEVFQQTMNFFERNLRKIPLENGFNAQSHPEIPPEVLQELVINALIHRNYFIRAEIRIAIFDDRIEIISPGTLPNSLTIANIKAGTSIPRNPILQQNAQYLLPYKGWGTGIRRALELYPNINFVNDIDRQTFTAILHRKTT